MSEKLLCGFHVHACRYEIGSERCPQAVKIGIPLRIVYIRHFGLCKVTAQHPDDVLGTG
ncbi:MAG: hypothetical protein ABIG44_04300 [Planctomycetota bacterium]